MDRSHWKRLVIGGGIAVFAGCATTPELGPEDFAEANRVTEEIAAAEPAAPPADKAALLGEDDPELAEAVRQFQQTGKAPVVRKPGFVVFPYGERQPILYCKPLRVCDIQLEAGEGVLNIALGDSERWIASKMESGPEDARQAHVVVKPTEFDLSTNLVEIISAEWAAWLRRGPKPRAAIGGTFAIPTATEDSKGLARRTNRAQNRGEAARALERESVGSLSASMRDSHEALGRPPSANPGRGARIAAEAERAPANS